MADPEQIVFGENGVVVGYKAPLSVETTIEENDEKLVWREPLWTFAVLAWVFAGPLNPAGIAAILLLGMPVYGAVLLLALPSTIGVGLFLLRRRGRPITVAGLIGSVLGWALATIPIYMALFLMFTLGSRGIEAGFLAMLQQGVIGALFGLLISPIYGLFALVFAVPAAFGAIIALRVIALRRDQSGEPIPKTAAHYTP